MKYIFCVGALLLVMVVGGCDETPPDVSAMSDVEAARALAEGAILADILAVDINADALMILIDYEMLGGLENVARLNMGEMLCALKGSGRFDGYGMQFIGKVTFVDALGNEFIENGLAVRILPDIARQINCENEGAGVQWDVVADTYNLNPALR